ncbi:MAG: ATP-binding cassette domain-containing protein [Candidatus Egerieousia sp.]|nr:ATP-binding cassette domain-containing protein [Candidatus Egerieousia sp.]
MIQEPTLQESPLVELQNYLPRAPFQFAEPINLKLFRGENWLVYGLNGSGKSILAKTLMKSYQSLCGTITHNLPGNDWNRITSNMAHLSFNSQYGGSDEGMCYQMRWNQGLLDDSLPKVKDVLSLSKLPGCFSHLKLENLMERYIISLSSGEFRRFQIAQMLCTGARIIIIENPYIGLDEQNRAVVAELLQELVKISGVQLILLESRLPENLSIFSHIVLIEDGRVAKYPLNEGLAAIKTAAVKTAAKDYSTAHSVTAECGKELLKLQNVSIRYGNRTILKDLSWSLKAGEKWALTGRNGSGKSTLLSLICADNPQAYSCNITLFGRKRGTGESIWDIKRNIGYLSPEMYKSYRKPLPVENIVASGLFDTIGLYVEPKEEHLQSVKRWMELFNLSRFRGTNYMHLSDGWQRMVLLARAFVKNPPLLILDEPFHGLDNKNRTLAAEIIESWCRQPEKSLIMVSHYKEDFPKSITHTLDLSPEAQFAH